MVTRWQSVFLVMKGRGAARTRCALYKTCGESGSLARGGCIGLPALVSVDLLRTVGGRCFVRAEASTSRYIKRNLEH